MTAFALHACLRKRLGCRFGGPDYAERDAIDKLRRSGLLRGAKNSPR